MHKVNILGYIAIPLAFLVHFVLGKDKSWEPLATFSLAALGVIPLAHLMGEATEHLSDKTGPTWGGLLNATFGNAAEFIIAIIADAGTCRKFKASLTGSILEIFMVAGAAWSSGLEARRSSADRRPR
jgi:Ca2+:H+ antiporter